MENQLLRWNEQLFETGLLSDATIKCGDRKWNVHKSILCSRCMHFEKPFIGEWSESQTGEIQIDEFDPLVVDGLLRYIYTGALRLVYADTPSGDTNLTDIRKAFVDFIRTGRFRFLEDAYFNRFLDEQVPALALDLFRTMRKAGDLSGVCASAGQGQSRGPSGIIRTSCPKCPRSYPLIQTLSRPWTLSCPRRAFGSGRP
ncbi:BTB/POZ protein [Achaetomium macrosporum]|uniref:BTB/POZ protein n=1 Tax=Achaetomium macrosporum TaxID=79813 RepID=A0AAN7H7L9_9PEZI|nr:BTB/POZ protein [Achaetomium macrosporum]